MYQPMIQKRPSTRLIELLGPVAVVLVMLGGQAWAESSRQNRQASKKHFRQAEQHYKLGRFDQALQDYSKAYELLPLPAFLFNIGQCHRKMLNYERAIFFFRGYLRELPSANNRKTVEDLIAECTRLLEEQLAKRQSDKEKQARERQLALEKEKAEAEAKAQAARAAAEAAASKRRTAVVVKKPDPYYKTWWFWTLVGTAVAAVAGTTWALASQETVVLPEGSLGVVDWR